MKNKKRVFVFLFVCIFLMLGLRLHAQESDEIQERVKKAESAGLLDWIDEEGYLIDRYFAGKSDAELSELSIESYCNYIVLLKTMKVEGDLEDYGIVQIGETENYLVYRNTPVDFW